LTYHDGRTPKQWSPASILFSLSSSNEEERRVHGGTVETTEEESRNKTFRRRWQRLLLHEGLSLFIDGKVKTSLIQISNLRKSQSTSQDSRSTESAKYQSLLPHDLSHNDARIEDTHHRFRANPIN